MTTKASLRRHYQTLRHTLPPRAIETLPLETPGYVLSFCSHKGEVDTSPLNAWLASQNRLALPRIEEDAIRAYSVNDLETQLKRGSFNLLEPDPTTCGRLEPDVIAYVLVPGLAFDREHHRLGYGRGFYDRLLAIVPAITIGLGYKEQLTKRLPTEPHDIQLTHLHLV